MRCAAHALGTRSEYLEQSRDVLPGGRLVLVRGIDSDLSYPGRKVLSVRVSRLQDRPCVNPQFILRRGVEAVREQIHGPPNRLTRGQKKPPNPTFAIAERVERQLADPRLGPLQGRLSNADLQRLVNSPNASTIRRRATSTIDIS